MLHPILHPKPTRRNTPFFWPLLTLLVTLPLAAQQRITLDGVSNAILNDFDKPFVYAYKAFKDKATVQNGVARINASRGNGGAGHTETIEVLGLTDECPVLILRLGPNNEAETIRLIVDDPDKNQRVFVYALDRANADSFAVLYPEHGLALAPQAMGESDNPFDPTRIKGHHLQGDWQAKPLDVYIDRIELRRPRHEHAAQRQAYLSELEADQQKAREKAQRIAEQRARQLEGAKHEPDGPRVVSVGAVTADLLSVRVQEREHVRRPQVPYVPQDGDIIETGKKKQLGWEDGKPAWSAGRGVKREMPDRKNPQGLGELVAGGTMLSRGAELRGTTITDLTLGEPLAYFVRSTADSRYRTPQAPEAVHLKAKPLGTGEGGVVRDITVYLELPHPMREGATYTIEFKGVNTAQPTVEFKYDSRVSVTPAIHVSHVGFRPDDPYKRAFLSQWLGTGGPHAFDDAEAFELLDEHGRVAFRGSINKVLDADEAENLHDANRTGTHVYAMDFSAFAQTGTYRVHVPGVGVSMPFAINADVWRDAFAHGMKGFLTHRSGIELSADLVGYHRPRPMHPDDGFVVFQTDLSFFNGESDAIRVSLERLLGENLDPAGLQRLPQAWGGYMDAGDWDRRSQHLNATYLVLENFRLFPEAMARVELTLPADEAANDVPDVLDEALWNVAFYQRLQTPEGGVRGGVESTAHPRGGEASWQESLLAGAFVPDPLSSYRFAATAALLSKLIEPYDTSTASGLARDAARAFEWADRYGDEVLRDMAGREPKKPKYESMAGDTRNARALAAVELLRLTSDPRYHAAFLQSSNLAAAGDRSGQLNAHFAYATLPERLRDADLTNRAREVVLAEADKTVAFGQGNAFGISHRIASLPLMGWVCYYTVPEAVTGYVLPRAHYLTGEERYLAAALRATGFAVGANPMGMTMTTGLGHASPQHPLHVDARNAGLPTPPGITVYGNLDPARAPGWVKQWFLNNKLVPDADQWPTAEFYIDLGNWPEMNEYTIHQNIGPIAYYWSYLAARP